MTVPEFEERPRRAHVRVAVRVRPQLPDEEKLGCRDEVYTTGGKQVVAGPNSFSFDHAFDQQTSQSRLYKTCVRPLVDAALDGYNATVFAYGQTGAGKTHTMGTAYNSVQSDGMVPRAVRDLLRYSPPAGTEVRFLASFLEIHKEKLRDLLDPSALQGTQKEKMLEIREDRWNGIYVSNAHEEEVTDINSVSVLLERGMKIRTTGCHDMNAASSRSHAIFTLVVQQKRQIEVDDQSDDEDARFEYLCSKFHFVDLAGSERVGRTNAEGETFKESTFINYGLLALGNVINALSTKATKGTGAHVPYRDSKLTRVLQDSLGGNSRTLMIACVGPTDMNLEETTNTLRYANRARNIQNAPVVNRDPYSLLVSKLRDEIQTLKKQLKGVASKNNGFENNGNSESRPDSGPSEEVMRELALAQARCLGLEQERRRLLKENEMLSTATFGEMGGVVDDASIDPSVRQKMPVAVSIDEDPFKADRRVRGLMDDIDVDVETKQGQLTELLSAQDKLDSMQRALESKMADVEDATLQAEREQERVHQQLKDLAAKANGRDTKERERRYQERLNLLTEELKVLRRTARDKERLEVAKGQSEDKIKSLNNELASLRGARAQLEKVLSEQEKRHRMETRMMDKQISKLKGDANKAEKRAQALEEQLKRRADRGDLSSRGSSRSSQSRESRRGSLSSRGSSRGDVGGGEPRRLWSRGSGSESIEPPPTRESTRPPREDNQSRLTFRSDAAFTAPGDLNNRITTPSTVMDGDLNGGRVTALSAPPQGSLTKQPFVISVGKVSNQRANPTRTSHNDASTIRANAKAVRHGRSAVDSVLGPALGGVSLDGGFLKNNTGRRKGVAKGAANFGDLFAGGSGVGRKAKGSATQRVLKPGEAQAIARARAEAQVRAMMAQGSIELPASLQPQQSSSPKGPSGKRFGDGAGVPRGGAVAWSERDPMVVQTRRSDDSMTPSMAATLQSLSAGSPAARWLAQSSTSPRGVSKAIPSLDNAVIDPRVMQPKAPPKGAPTRISSQPHRKIGSQTETSPIKGVKSPGGAWRTDMLASEVDSLSHEITEMLAKLSYQ